MEIKFYNYPIHRWNINNRISKTNGWDGKTWFIDFLWFRIVIRK